PEQAPVPIVAALPATTPFSVADPIPGPPPAAVEAVSAMTPPAREAEPFEAGCRAGFPRKALAPAAILLALAVIAAVLLPAPVSMILHRNQDKQAIGVPVGV